MLAGMTISSFTLLTASTASPNEAPGARLNDSVTTGNWPWWFTVIGTDVISTRLKALSGTWPPFGKAWLDAGGAPKALLDAVEVDVLPPVVTAPVSPRELVEAEDP